MQIPYVKFINQACSYTCFLLLIFLATARQGIHSYYIIPKPSPAQELETSLIIHRVMYIIYVKLMIMSSNINTQ